MSGLAVPGQAHAACPAARKCARTCVQCKPWCRWPLLPGRSLRQQQLAHAALQWEAVRVLAAQGALQRQAVAMDTRQLPTQGVCVYHSFVRLATYQPGAVRDTPWLPVVWPVLERTFEVGPLAHGHALCLHKGGLLALAASACAAPGSPWGLRHLQDQTGHLSPPPQPRLCSACVRGLLSLRRRMRPGRPSLRCSAAQAR